MSNDEILKAAQAGKPNNEYENKESDRGILLGLFVGIVFCILVNIAEYLIHKQFNISMLASVFIIATIYYLFVGFRTKRKTAIVLGCVYCVLAVFFTLCYIGGLLGLL